MPNKHAQPQPKQAAQTNKDKLEQYRATAAQNLVVQQLRLGCPAESV